MRKQIKHIAKMAVTILAAAILIGSLPGCAAQKCDCPTFGGHRLKH